MDYSRRAVSSALERQNGRGVSGKEYAKMENRTTSSASPGLGMNKAKTIVSMLSNWPERADDEG
jgi:hypothetical protein